MKEKILHLRSKGKSYNSIVKILGCSKATVSYHCGKGQKEKNNVRNKRNKSTIIYRINAKIDSFRARSDSGYYGYVKRDSVTKKYQDKILKNPSCYLTGRDINLLDVDSYSLDHVNPFNLSKDNSVRNMGISCKEANLSKSFMTVKQYLSLCKEVLEHNGYKVIKIKKT